MTGDLASTARSVLDRRPIALAGFMGVGKSTVGRVLAELLQRPFYDADAEVERQGGRPLSFYFPDHEAAFRRLEAEVVADLLNRGPAVIALGGGALMNPQTSERLSRLSVLVHLHVPWSSMRGHVPSLAASRPLLQGRSLADIHRLYVARLAVYRRAPIQVTVRRSHPDDTQRAALAVLRALVAAQPSRPSDAEIGFQRPTPR